MRKFFNIFAKTSQKQRSKKTGHIFNPRLKRLREEADEARAIFKKKQDQLMEQLGFGSGTEEGSAHEQELHNASVLSAVSNKTSCNGNSSRKDCRDVEESNSQDTDKKDKCVPSASASWVFTPRGWF